MKILLVGPYPPPKGGVSTHLQRLAALLEARDVNVSIVDEAPAIKPGVFNLRSLNVLRYVKSYFGADVVHIHSSVDVLRVVNILAALLFNKTVIVTLHSWRGKGAIARKIHNLLFRWVDMIICVNAEIAGSIGAKNKIVKPAFIPPEMHKEMELSDEIREWLAKQKSQGRTILASNAYQLNQHKGQDIYGVDICIKATRNLIELQGLRVSFIFAVASMRANNHLFEDYKSTIREHGLEDHFLLIHEPHLSFVNLMERADIVIRATNTDGDALSVREALYLQRPVIASDVVERPTGVVLFESRNVEDLSKKIETLINNKLLTEYRDSLRDNDDYASFYQGLYQQELP